MPDTLKAHIEHLAEGLDTTLHFEKGRAHRHAFASLVYCDSEDVECVRLPKGRHVVTGEWRGAVEDYYVVLHELGHHAHKHTDLTYFQYLAVPWPVKVENEAEAWAWALEHALVKPDLTTRDKIRTDWLGTYIRDVWPNEKQQLGSVTLRLAHEFNIDL